jgi:perosamine synthetase
MTSRPAILGGRAAITLDQREANRWPIITAEDEAAVLDVLRSGDLTSNPVTRALEQDYREYFGVRHALSHCNGTVALLAAFFAIGLRPGDEVIVPSATWWSSVLPMMWLGAVPVFAEGEHERGGLDPLDVRQRITSRTRAMVIVHLWGMPSRITELLAIAREFGLTVIEDASHAHGAIWRGRKCGTLGDVAVFSLQGHKLAPAGEGGMLLTDRDDVIERASLLGDVNPHLGTPNARPPVCRHDIRYEDAHGAPQRGCRAGAVAPPRRTQRSAQRKPELSFGASGSPRL